MKQTKVLLATAVLAMAAAGQSAKAQVELPFEAVAPQWSKAVVAPEAGAMMYQKASTSAPSLVFDFFNADEYEPTTFLPSWSNTVSRAHAQAYPLKGVAPVLSETSGWVEIDHVPEIEGKGYSFKVWVPVQSLTVSAITPVTGAGADLRVFDDGDLAGYGVYRSHADGRTDLYFGRMVDGKLICPYVLESDADVASLSADDVKALLPAGKAVRQGQVMVVYAVDGAGLGSQWWVKD